MFTLINFNYPLRSAIIFYVIMISIIIALRPRLLDTRKNRISLILTIIIVSIISYYIFAMISCWFKY